jgi:cyclophilin family peptidyl-prolyl cis-trans isomerase/HEAT repeat protein
VWVPGALVLGALVPGALVLGAGVLGAGVLGAAVLGAQQPRPSKPIPLEVLRQMAQPLGAEPVEVLIAEKGWGAADALMPLARSENRTVRDAAVRALGRLEQPSLVMPLLSLPGITLSARADAIAQSLKGFDPNSDPRLVQTALEWLYVNGDLPLDQNSIAIVPAVMSPLGRIQYATAEQMRKAERLILRITLFARPDPRLGGVYVMGIRALENLARANTKVAALDEDTVSELEKAVNKQATNDNPTTGFLALSALINGRGLTEDTERIALKYDAPAVRRLAMTILAGGGAGIDDATRVRLIEEGLGDPSAQVRYEALRAYARRGARTNGCGPILDRRDDRDLHVVLAALDALGDQCKDDEEITSVVMAEARVPPTVGSWHRETHAFVALAKRSPEKAAIQMDAFVTHPVWWVRMYAAGAAAVTGNVALLERLANDGNDNVREAAIEAWYRLKRDEAVPAVVAALERSDPQLLRTAARLLQDLPRNTAFSRPLIASLMRATREGKETSRDTRLALLDAINVHTTRDDAAGLMPLLRDFDERVAARASHIIAEWTGRAAAAAPETRPRGWPQAFSDLRQCVTVDLGGTGSFRMRMQPGSAPIAVDRFLQLAAKDKYYNGLTFHRVVPNFVIQGGSPGANEYAGHKDYMRDEVGGHNVRGAVGLSTRGRNTGDAQFFINLVDNTRLDYDYTVFAIVEDMTVVDKIQEGDVIRSIDIVKCGG